MSMEISRRTLLQSAAVPALLPWFRWPEIQPTTSRVYPGVDGKLVYVPDEQGNTILDS
jgi:hypothetical protein